MTHAPFAMPPVFRFCLAFAGTLLFGWPLWAMLQNGGKPYRPPSFAVAESRKATAPALLTVRFTGTPARLDIYRRGERVLSLPAGASSPWEAEIELPEQARALNLRVDALWETPGAQAVTLETEPERKRAREATRWARGGRLNDIFSFTW